MTVDNISDSEKEIGDVYDEDDAEREVALIGSARVQDHIEEGASRKGLGPKKEERYRIIRKRVEQEREVAAVRVPRQGRYERYLKASRII